MSPKPPQIDRSAGGLAITTLGDVRVLGRLGEGGRSTVHRASWHGRDVALKLYKASAVLRHARKHPQHLAEFEYERNAAFWRAPGLARYVAEPLGFLATSGVAAFVQELLCGELYYFYYRRHGERVRPGLQRHVERMVELYHAAGLYDVDLHSMNVMVVEAPDGEPIPKLFDFNLVPFHLHPPNPLVALLLRLGLLTPRARDLRKLREFHDFRRVEARLLQFYE